MDSQRDYSADQRVVHFFSRDQREGGLSADISSLACYGLLLSSADKL